MKPTYKVVIDNCLRAAPFRKVTYEGVRDLEGAMDMAREQVHIDSDGFDAHRDELAVTGRTTWGYAFEDVTIEREQQPQQPADHICAFAPDPQPNNQWQTKCQACGDTLPFRESREQGGMKT